MERILYPSPIGDLLITMDGSILKRIDHQTAKPKAPFAYSKNRVTEALDKYFSGSLQQFRLQFKTEGTAFQKKVWEALLSIPYGETASYGAVARTIGSPLACRAVGMANNRNPISIVIPCHRVIGANGQLVGYGGGLDRKEALLKHEQAVLAKKQTR